MKTHPSSVGAVERAIPLAAGGAGALGGGVRSGVFWSGLALIAESGLRFLVKLVLARLLVPEHFGLIGMAVVFTGLVQAASELGLSAAIVQRKESKLGSIDLSTTFWASCLLGVAAYLVLALVIGPLAAAFYGEQVVWPIMLVVGLSLLLRPLVVVHRALLSRNLNFKGIAYVTVASVAVSSVAAITLAAFGAGVWSIAWQGVIAALVTVPLMWRVSSWRPEPTFSWDSLSNTLGFAGYVTGNDIAVYLTKNIDYLLIGKFVGAGALGAYTLAFLLTDTFRSSMMSVMNRVMYPVYGRLQDDTTTVREYYLRVIRFNMLPLVPIMVLLATLAEPLVIVGFGVAWREAVFPLQLLSLAVIVHTFGGTAASVMRGVGRADLEFKQYLLRSVLFNLPVLVIAIYFAGINGAAVAVLLIKILGRMVQQQILRRLIAIREAHVFKAAAPALLAGIGMWVTINLLSTVLPPRGIPELILHSCVALTAYAVIAAPFVRRELGALTSRASRV